MSGSLDKWLSEGLSGVTPSEARVKSICSSLKSLLVNEPNIISVAAPVTIVGDLHGQFYDLLELFRVAGSCPDTSYLFLGDYVDRGSFSVETATYLALLKLRWPNRVTLLRGNHESRSLTQVYGFYAECMRKYGNARVWQMFVDLFEYLPIAAVVSNSIYCVHGGLSPSLDTLDQVRVVDRFCEISEGPLADMMWSDPDPSVTSFQPSNRGNGYLYGETQVDRFLRFNHLRSIVRSHQLCMDGFQHLFKETLTTIWSAPNYCYRCGNLASVLSISEDLTNTFVVYAAAPDFARKRHSFGSTKEVPDYFL